MNAMRKDDLEGYRQTVEAFNEIILQGISEMVDFEDTSLKLAKQCAHIARQLIGKDRVQMGKYILASIKSLPFPGITLEEVKWPMPESTGPNHKESSDDPEEG